MRVKVASGPVEVVEAFAEVCDYTMHAHGGTVLLDAAEWNKHCPEVYGKRYGTVKEGYKVLAVRDGWEQYKKTIDDMRTAFQYFQKGWNAKG